MRGLEQVWAEDIDDVNKRADQDRQWYEPHIQPYPGWRLEITDMDYTNSRISAGLSSDEIEFRNDVDGAYSQHVLWSTS
jgi:hypothetical protein